MEVLDKDNKIRNAIPITGILWIVFSYGIYRFIIDIGFPLYKFLAETNSRPIDSWNIVNVAVIVFLGITVPVCFYSCYTSFQAVKERKKWEKEVEQLQENSKKAQEMLENAGEITARAEKVEKEKNEEYKKAKNFAKEAQSMVDELKQKLWNKS